jgi:hypothetical protein
MGLSVNDLSTRAWTKINAATGDATVTGAIRIMAVNINHTATATLLLYNALTQAGTDLITVRTAANDSRFICFGPNGVRFGTGLSLTLSAGVAEVYYVAE